MKKKCFFIAILILALFCFKNNVYASNILEYESNYNYILDTSAVEAFSCSNENVIKVLKLFSIMFFILKIAIPIIIVILGTISLVKVILSDDQGMLSKSISSLLLKIVLGIFIFFLPNLISTIIGYIDEANNVKSEFAVCSQCLLDYSKCPGYSTNTKQKDSANNKINNQKQNKNNTTTIDVDGFTGSSGKF